MILMKECMATGSNCSPLLTPQHLIGLPLTILGLVGFMVGLKVMIEKAEDTWESWTVDRGTQA